MTEHAERLIVNGLIGVLGVLAVGIQVAEGIAWVVKHKGEIPTGGARSTAWSGTSQTRP